MSLSSRARRLMLPVTVSHGAPLERGTGRGSRSRERLKGWRGSNYRPLTDANRLTNNGALTIFLKWGWLPSGHIRGLKGASFTRVH
jgi:hypothetical protein